MTLSTDQFERLALEQMDTLYRVARRLTRNPAAAEDLVQETYVRALRARDSFDLHEFGIRPWLLRILHNLYLNQLERHGREPQAVPDEQIDLASADAPDLPPLEPGSFEGMDEQVVRALDALPHEYSAVLLLWAVEDLSYKEIGQALEIPIGTVMSRLHRARQRLSEQLRQFAVQEGIIRK